MNAEPHTHQVQVRRRFAGTNDGGWIVRYGDTVVSVSLIGRVWYDHAERPLSERRVKRAIRKAIRRHDRGSLKAGRKAARCEVSYNAATEANKALQADTGAWGSSLVKG